MDDKEIKIILENAKTIAMIGISSNEIYARFWIQSNSNKSLR